MTAPVRLMLGPDPYVYIAEYIITRSTAKVALVRKQLLPIL